MQKIIVSCFKNENHIFFKKKKKKQTKGGANG